MRAVLVRRSRLLSLAAAVVLALLALRPRPVTPLQAADAPVAAHGTATFGNVRALHDSAIRGDLPALRAAAAWLAERESTPTRGASLTAQRDSFRRTATRAAAAGDVPTAAAAVADAIAACGTCHQAAGVQPRLPAIETPWQTSIVGHMRRHARAAEEMIHGMVIPSGRLWLAGTTAFAESPLGPGDFPVDVRRGDAMAQLEAQLHRLAQDAFIAETPASRARAYGQLLAACAGCHGRHTRP